MGFVRVKPVVHNETCETCGVCIRECPAELLLELREEENSLRQQVYKGICIAEKPWQDGEFVRPPCQITCPIGQDVRTFVRRISEKNYAGAFSTIRETNALPGVTAYVCHHPCEAQCIRNFIDEPLAIRTLKQFLLCQRMDNERNLPNVLQAKSKRVVIVGSGPAGFAAAYELIRDGYMVEMIEALSEPGGMLRWALPSFRLPREVLNRDIQYLQTLGVKIRTRITFGVDITLADLKAEGTGAILLAIGTHRSEETDLGCKDAAKGFVDCLTFLKQYADGKLMDLGSRVVVIGGGNAAIDSARVARRCGVKEVSVIYRRGYKEMPADKAELTHAEAEGIMVRYFTLPVRIILKAGAVHGVECVKTELCGLDESGRGTPIPIEGSEFVIHASGVISAVGQKPDMMWNQTGEPFTLSAHNTFVTDGELATNLQGVFAAGDCVTGPSTVVGAMASGRRAACSIRNYLRE